VVVPVVVPVVVESSLPAMLCGGCEDVVVYGCTIVKWLGRLLLWSGQRCKDVLILGWVGRS
jgi:hypothetical protein